VLDWVTHRPDLPLWPGGPEVGIGLWNSVPGTLIVEGFLLALGVFAIYRMVGVGRGGHVALWSLVLLTGGIWASQPWAPPAPNPTAVAGVTLTLWLLPFWGIWIERHLATEPISLRA